MSTPAAAWETPPAASPEDREPAAPFLFVDLPNIGSKATRAAISSPDVPGQPVNKRLSGPQSGNHAILGLGGAEPWFHRPTFHHGDALVSQQIDARVILREAPRRGFSTS